MQTLRRPESTKQYGLIIRPGRNILDPRASDNRPKLSRQFLCWGFAGEMFSADQSFTVCFCLMRSACMNNQCNNTKKNPMGWMAHRHPPHPTLFFLLGKKVRNPKYIQRNMQLLFGSRVPIASIQINKFWPEMLPRCASADEIWLQKVIWAV